MWIVPKKDRIDEPPADEESKDLGKYFGNKRQIEEESEVFSTFRDQTADFISNLHPRTIEVQGVDPSEQETINPNQPIESSIFKQHSE